MDETEITRRLDLVTDLFGLFGRPIQESTIKMFFRATSHMSNGRFDKAVDKCSSECRFMPSPAEFMESVGSRPLQPTTEEVNAAYRKRWGITE